MMALPGTEVDEVLLWCVSLGLISREHRCRGIHLGGSHAIGHQLGAMNVAHGKLPTLLFSHPLYSSR